MHCVPAEILSASWAFRRSLFVISSNGLTGCICGSHARAFYLYYIVGFQFLIARLADIFVLVPLLVCCTSQHPVYEVHPVN